MSSKVVKTLFAKMKVPHKDDKKEEKKIEKIKEKVIQKKIEQIIIEDDENKDFNEGLLSDDDQDNN